MTAVQPTPEQIVEEWQSTLSAQKTNADHRSEPEQHVPWLRGLLVTNALLVALAAEIFHVVTTKG